MKVVSLVPSWTETLLNAGVDVVGRTRFCIHPAEKVRLIPVVGGTKDLKIDKMLELNPDYVLLDQEENTRLMADEIRQAGIRTIVTHVQSIESCISGLQMMAEAFKNHSLLQYSERYQKILKNKHQIRPMAIPHNTLVRYLIWRHPWMEVSRNTFIGDVLSLQGIQLLTSDRRYPELTDSEVQQSYCLFSTEPYPFEKKWDEIQKSNISGQLIDGESISWYGVRNLVYLESLITD